MEAYTRRGKITITKKQVREMMGRDIKSWKEHRPNRVRSVDFAAGDNVGQAKRWPSTIPCDSCGDLMDLINVEEAYSCRNKDCDCHMEEA